MVGRRTDKTAAVCTAPRQHGLSTEATMAAQAPTRIEGMAFARRAAAVRGGAERVTSLPMRTTRTLRMTFAHSSGSDVCVVAASRCPRVHMCFKVCCARKHRAGAGAGGAPTGKAGALAACAWRTKRFIQASVGRWLGRWRVGALGVDTCWGVPLAAPNHRVARWFKLDRASFKYFVPNKALNGCVRPSWTAPRARTRVCVRATVLCARVACVRARLAAGALDSHAMVRAGTSVPRVVCPALSRPAVGKANNGLKGWVPLNTVSASAKPRTARTPSHRCQPGKWPSCSGLCGAAHAAAHTQRHTRHPCATTVRRPACVCSLVARRPQCPPNPGDKHCGAGRDGPAAPQHLRSQVGTRRPPCSPAPHLSLSLSLADVCNATCASSQCLRALPPSRAPLCSPPPAPWSDLSVPLCSPSAVQLTSPRSCTRRSTLVGTATDRTAAS